MPEPLEHCEAGHTFICLCNTTEFNWRRGDPLRGLKPAKPWQPKNDESPPAEPGD
jgi:hypothetical protein